MILIYNKSKENFNAGPKAPRDVAAILKEKFSCEEKAYYYIDYKNIIINKVINNIKRNFFIRKLKTNRSLCIVQMPFSRSNAFQTFIKKNNTILFIHDLIGLRTQNKRVEKREINIYKKATYIIAHNSEMKKYLIDKGIDKKRIIELGIFDYLCINKDKNTKPNDFNSIVFAGNLSKLKSQFLYNIDIKKINFKINLYGVNPDKDLYDSFSYKGKAIPDELPSKIDGKVGLVWDGECDNSDENSPVKNYTKYNNPHKLSCYIAAEIPVIVWEKSAVASFVKEYNIGYTINNIYDINKIDFSDINKKKNNVIKLSAKVKEGYFTKQAIDKVLKRRRI